MALKNSASPVRYTSDVVADCNNSNRTEQRNDKTIKPMSFKTDKHKSEHRSNNADSVAEQFLAN